MINFLTRNAILMLLILGIILNYEKTLMIIQNSRHILFDTRRETKVTLNKLVTATYGENPGVVASSNANFASTNCVKNVIAAACVAFSLLLYRGIQHQYTELNLT